MSREKRQRYAFFACAVLLHVVAFLVICRFVIFAPEALDPDEKVNFHLVKIALPPTAPPEATPASGPVVKLPDLSAAPAIRYAPVSVAPLKVITSANGNFAMPKFDPSDIPTAVVQQVEAPYRGPEDGNGPNNAPSTYGSTGQGRGAIDDSGVAVLVGDSSLPTDAKVALVLDISGSMQRLKYPEITIQRLNAHYPNALLVASYGARGEYAPDTKIWRPNSEHPAPGAYNWGTGGPIPNFFLVNSVNSEGLYASPRALPTGTYVPSNACSVDLYSGIYYAIKCGMTSVIVVTDFEDGEVPAATQDVITAMRAAHLRLFIVSVEMQPYHGLSDYARESGGVTVVSDRHYNPYSSTLDNQENLNPLDDSPAAPAYTRPLPPPQAAPPKSPEMTVNTPPNATQ